MMLLILGAGGHGKAVAEAAELSCAFPSIAFLDDGWPTNKMSAHWPIIGRPNDIATHTSQYSAAIPAIGNNAIRAIWATHILDANMQLANVVHPAANVSPNAKLNGGCAVMAGAIVGFGSVLGMGCIINCHATVDHDVVLGDFAHLGVGVQLAGGTKIGPRSFLEAGSCAGYGVDLPPDTHGMPGTVYSASKVEI